MVITETWWLVVRNGLASVRFSQYSSVEDADFRRHNDWLTDLTTAAISLVPPDDGPRLTTCEHQDTNYGSRDCLQKFDTTNSYSSAIPLAVDGPLRF